MAGGNQVIDIALQTDPQRVNFNLQNSGGSVSFDLSNGSDMSSRFIDDTAGAGVTNKTWSADKLTTEFDEKADKTDTVLETTLSRGRKANTTVGEGSIAFGKNAQATGKHSYAFGEEAKAQNDYAFTEGYYTQASGQISHAEGSSTTASGLASHAEGGGTLASGQDSHSEGNNTRAQGSFSHAEGVGNTASGNYGSHAEGSMNTASGNTSHAEGFHTIANHKSQHVFGEYNIEDPNTSAATARGTYVEIVGNGTGDDARSNIRTLDWNGNENLAGDLTINKGTANEVSVSDLVEEVASKAEIDDTAGIGDSTKVWSADKSATETNSLKSALNGFPIFATKGSAVPGAKTSNDNITPTGDTTKFRSFDLDAKRLKLYSRLTLRLINNTGYHMLMIFVVRASDMSKIQTITWREVKDGDNLLDKFSSYLTNAAIVSVSYAFSTSTSTSNIQAGIADMAYDFYMKIDTMDVETEQNAYNIEMRKNETHRGNDGIDTLSLYSDFVHGDLSSGVLDPTKKYRVSSKDIMTFDRAITLNIKNGFGIGVHYFVGGVFDSDSGWQTGSYDIPQGTTCKIVITRAPYDATEIADIETFVDTVTFDTSVNETLNTIYNDGKTNAVINYLSEEENTIVSSGSSGLASTKQWIVRHFNAGDYIEEMAVMIQSSSLTLASLEVWYTDDGKTYTQNRSISAVRTEAGGSSKYIAYYPAFTMAKNGFASIKSGLDSGGFGAYVTSSGNKVLYFNKASSSIDIDASSVLDDAVVCYKLKMYSKVHAPVTVKADGTGDYLRVTDAVDNEPENTPILIYPGVYDGTVEAFTKRIILIGMDRNTCIIRSKNGLYRYPAINASCGYISNLTIKSEYVSGESNEVGASTNGAYAIHCENEYGVGKILELHHCILQSDFFPAIGAGLRKNFRLIIDDCELINSQILNRGNYTADGSLGALYFHDTNGEKGAQSIMVKNCVMHSSLGNSMTIYRAYHYTEGSVVTCDFIGNVLHDAINGYSNNIWERDSNPFSSGAFEIGIGYGNSNSYLNNNT